MDRPLGIVPRKSEPKQGQLGVVLSFTIKYSEGTMGAHYVAEQNLIRFAAAVAKLAKEGFPLLTHTMTSRQEYFPDDPFRASGQPPKGERP